MLRHLLQVHANRHALGEAYPGKGRSDGRQQVTAGTAVGLRDAPAQAVYHTRERRIRVGHQGDHGVITGLDVGDNVIAGGVHQRQCRLVRDRLGANSEFEVGHITVHRGTHLGEFEIESGRFLVRYRLVVGGFCLVEIPL